MKCFVCRKEIPPEDDQLLHWTSEIKVHMACGVAAKMLEKIADMRQKLIDVRKQLATERELANLDLAMMERGSKALGTLPGEAHDEACERAAKRIADLEKENLRIPLDLTPDGYPTGWDS